MSERAYKKAIALIRAGTQLERINALLSRIKARMAEIDALVAEFADQWAEEDGVYRFYHQSMKVFHLQAPVRKAFKLISEIGGEEDQPNEWYCQIVKEGTEHDFNEQTDDDWLAQTRPIREAFWHTKYFLTMMAKYGKELETVTMPIASGWAAVLCLFELR
jgi:hypothetical protein